MRNVIEAIERTRIVAVVRLEQYDQAVNVARALVAGGITAIEYTHTGTGVDDAVSAARAALGDQAQIGVGTVLDADLATASIDAGAQFVVTPALRPTVIAACRSRGVPMLCGALTPTEILAAHEAGADMIKIFPARAVGPQYLCDILAPLPMLRLVPTGGIGPENAQSYLQAGAIAVGIGGNLVAPPVVVRGDWAQISAQARACVDAIRTYQPTQ
jgi:2-dehydro-3-deoxyphosphogluconate aldolase/(4S)-4-hydroxy-2-oxoglutarate aldolase